MTAGLAGLERELSAALAGELHTDRLWCTLYATDASIYQIVPDGVVLPRSVADVVATVKACGRHGVPLTARGAGTGLTGGAVNRGLQLDCSRYLNRILNIDPGAGTARVEPGVVLDELNAAVKPHGLHFAPDVATSNRATLGGMIANNSCGAHSLLYGRTVDHLLSVEVVLADGSVCTWGAGSDATDNPLAQRCNQVLATVVRDYRDEIAARFPKLLRSNAGYALDRLHTAGGRVNAETVICGSEGTLAIIVGATLRLTPLPRCRGLLVVQFDELLAALEVVSPILEHRPAAVELIDDLILDATRDHPGLAGRRWWVTGAPKAVLVCELFDQDQARLKKRLAELESDLRSRSGAQNYQIITDPAAQADVWQVRKSGLGLLMSRPGDRRPYAFIEDAAVDPARLPQYIQRLDQLLAEEGIERTGHYAHASVGCLHVRPALDLKSADDIQRMRRIAERVCSLVAELGGTMNGEHGDGIACSIWLEKLYGARLVEAFRTIKSVFDPLGILNPGKIVDPLPMDANLRYGAGYQSQQPTTILDFSTWGGLAGLAEMCTGIGECRQRLTGTMCPSYMATGSELHTTRARANALRVALSNRGPLAGLGDPALDQVMDLCLSCKACRKECPSGVDLARLKTEWLAHRNRIRGVPRRSRLITEIPRLVRLASQLAPVSNRIMRHRITGVILEHWFGLDHRFPLPPLARPTFRQWWAARDRRATGPPPGGQARPPVVYFVDTWTNFFLPQVGQATVKVLEALGYQVRVPPVECCGRPLISKGLLREAAALAEANVRILAPYAERDIWIVGSEPSCISVLLDELPQLVRTSAARCVAAHATTIESFVVRHLREHPQTLRVRSRTVRLLYHGHCHQKALLGTEDAMALLNACTGGQASEIDSGCCGMAGSFGHEVEHYEVARAIGELRLFPAIRARGEAQVAISGFSCRQHIEHHLGVPARHPIEYLAEAIDAGPVQSR